MRKDATPDEHAVSWKVLLPISQESRVLALGMSDGELRGLARTFRHVDTSPNVRGYATIVLGDEASEPQTAGGYFSHMTSNGVLVAVGSSMVYDVVRQSGWRCVAEYACLPSSQPRIFIPLASKRVRNSGLDFHSPGSLRRKAWLWGAKGLSSIGITAHLRNKTVAFFTAGSQMDGEGSLKHWISRRTGWSVDEMVVYAGSESPARKITALGLSSDCCRQIVARIGDTDLAAAAIRQEAAALHVLAHSPLAGSVPALIAEGEYGPYVIQLQSCLPKVRGQCRTLSNAHIGFLSALSRINRTSVPIHRTAAWHIFIKVATSPEAGKLPEAIRHIASRLANDDTANRIVECHMIHGDFAPWNIICQDGSILAYDWEESNPVGFPFHDVFHFIYRQASLVGPWQGATGVLKAMRNAAVRLAHTSEIRCDVNLALSLWCIKEYTCKPAPRLVELATELERMKHE
jgi:hypothetical protein